MRRIVSIGLIAIALVVVIDARPARATGRSAEASVDTRQHTDTTPSSAARATTPPDANDDPDATELVVLGLAAVVLALVLTARRRRAERAAV
jgi:hypothetical protein